MAAVALEVKSQIGGDAADIPLGHAVEPVGTSFAIVP